LRGEQRFWEGVMNTANPGWQTKLTPGWGDLNSLSDLSVFSYIVDTSNGWTVMGAVTAQNFKDAQAQYEQIEKRQLKAYMDRIHNTMLAASDASAQPRTELAMNACVLSLVSLCDTSTFKLARQCSSSVEGHWISVLYRLKDGACLRRPAFSYPDGTSKPLEPAALYQVLRQIIKADSDPTSKVGQHILSAGGAAIHSGFRD